MNGTTLKGILRHVDTEKEFDALYYVQRIYSSFLQTSNEFCQITLNKSQAKKLVEEIDYIEQVLVDLETVKEADPSEALEHLEECANGMKDLPKSNWIDLANSEAELDLKIMDWVEVIKFGLFKGAQASSKTQQRLKEENNVLLGQNTDLYNELELTSKQYKELMKGAKQQNDALKTIFEKSVDVFRLKKLDFNTFNQLQRSCKLPELTEEEFNTLKGYSK